MKSSLKSKINITLRTAIILLLVIFLEYQPSSSIMNAQNSNLNRPLALNTFAVLDIATAGYQTPAIETTNEQSQIAVVTEEVPPQVEIEQASPIATYKGHMTGYVYNCPKCSGKLACDASLDLSDGNVNYYDSVYGDIRIVASSKNLPCGSIVSIKSEISNDPIVAIVLDRGVSGTTLDLLTKSEEEARTSIGRKDITYDVLRNGY